MGVDYKWGGSAGGMRFGQEIDRVANLFGGKLIEGSKGPNRYGLPEGANPCVVKFFDHLYGPLTVEETKEVWNEFQKHPEIEKIMPDMWNEFKCDAMYDEEFKLSYYKAGIMENSLSSQFQTAVMAYFPCTRISEDNGTLKATWELKPNYQYSVPTEQRKILIDAGLCPSIFSPLPMLVPYEFELAFDTATARTTINRYVTGYSDWPSRQLDGISELVNFLSRVQRSEVYRSVIDYTMFPEKILSREIFDSRRRMKDVGETEGNHLG